MFGALFLGLRVPITLAAPIWGLVVRPHRCTEAPTSGPGQDSLCPQVVVGGWAENKAIIQGGGGRILSSAIREWEKAALWGGREHGIPGGSNTELPPDSPRESLLCDVRARVTCPPISVRGGAGAEGARTWGAWWPQPSLPQPAPPSPQLLPRLSREGNSIGSPGPVPVAPEGFSAI